MYGLGSLHSLNYLLSENVHIFDKAIYILQMQQKEGKHETTDKITVLGVAVRVLVVGGFRGGLCEERRWAVPCWTQVVLAGSSGPNTGHS